MEFKVGVVGTCGCPSFRVELRIHIISHMMRVVVTDRMFSKIANIRHGVWMKRNGRAQLLPLLLSLVESLSRGASGGCPHWQCVVYC